MANTNDFNKVFPRGELKHTRSVCKVWFSE